MKLIIDLSMNSECKIPHRLRCKLNFLELIQFRFDAFQFTANLNRIVKNCRCHIHCGFTIITICEVNLIINMRKLFEFSGCNGRVKYLIRNIVLTVFPLGGGRVIRLTI